jgi:hypothetical protein
MSAASTHPHDVRIEARLMRYPNSHAEQENVTRVDRAVWDRVRIYEDQVANAAQDFIKQQEVHTTAADELETALRQEIRFVAEDRTAVTPTLVRRYEVLRRNAEQAIAALEAAKRRAEWHREKVSDPYAAYCDLMSKFPILKPAISAH